MLRVETYVIAFIVFVFASLSGFYLGRQNPREEAVKEEFSDQMASSFLKGKSEAMQEFKTLAVEECESIQKAQDPEKQKFMQ